MSSAVTDPDELWRLQYVQSGGWGDATTVAATALLTTFLNKKESRRDLSGNNVKREDRHYTGVSEWVSERGFDLHPPRLATRSPDWRWQLVRSYVLKRDCITGYLPKMRAANGDGDDGEDASGAGQHSRAAARARKAALLQRRVDARTAGYGGGGPPPPQPLPLDAPLEQQYAALVAYRAQLRSFLADEELAKDLARENAHYEQQQQQRLSHHGGASRASVDQNGLASTTRSLDESLLLGGQMRDAVVSPTTTTTRRSLSPAAAMTSPPLQQHSSLSAIGGTSGSVLRQQHPPDDGLLVAVRQVAKQEVRQALAHELGLSAAASSSASPHAAVETRMLDDETQRRVAAAEIRLLSETIDRMNADSAIERDLRVDVPPEIKLARRQWYGQRLRDGAYLNYSHRGAVSHLHAERHRQEVETGVSSPIRLRDLRPGTPGSPLDESCHGGHLPSRRTLLTPEPRTGGQRATAIPKLVSQRGLLSSSSPAPRAPSAQALSSPTPTTVVDRIMNRTEAVCRNVRGTRATRSQSAMGKLRRHASVPLSGIPPPARPASRVGATAASSTGARRDDVSSSSPAAAAPPTPDERRTRVETPVALWQRVTPNPGAAASAMSGATPLAVTTMACDPAIPVVDYSCLKLRHVADLLRVPGPRKINNKAPPAAKWRRAPTAATLDAGSSRAASVRRRASDLAKSAVSAKDPLPTASNVRVYDFGPTRNAAAAIYMKQQQQQQQPTHQAEIGVVSDGRRSPFGDESDNSPASDAPLRTAGAGALNATVSRAQQVRLVIDGVPDADRRFFMSDDATADLLEGFADRVGAPSTIAGTPARRRNVTGDHQQHRASPALPCGVLLLHNNGLRSTRRVVSRPSSSALTWSNQKTSESSFAGLPTVLSLLYGDGVWQRALVQIDLSENKLTEAPLEIADLPALRALKLHGNAIPTMDSVSELATKGGLGARLEALTLHGNPLVETLGKRGYPVTVRLVFSSLRQLDGRRLLADE